MADKIIIELSAADALQIYAFLHEYFNDSNKHVPEYKAMHDATDALLLEMGKSMRDEHFEDAEAEMSINRLLGKVPDDGK